MLNGIDVYEGNNVESWQQVKNSGIQTVIIKATQGVYHTDSLVYYRIPKIKQAGLYIGYYHFAEYNSKNPIEEAKHFLNVIKEKTLDTCLWVDVEIDDKWDKQIAINYTNQFVNYVQSQGYKIGLYTGESFYNSYLKGNIPNIPLWIANYGRQPATYPAHSWQYSETKRISGISGASDADYFNENILLSNSQSQPTYKQPNNFCKNQKGKVPLFKNYQLTGHTEFKEFPDEKSKTTGIKESGFIVNIYGIDYDNGYCLVNNNTEQYIKISQIKSTIELPIQKIVRVISSTANLYWNPSLDSKVNGTVEYGKILCVYEGYNHFYCVNSKDGHWQFINVNDVEQIYPNIFTDKLNTNSLPILENFQVNVDTIEVKEFPYELSNNVRELKRGDLVQIFGSFQDYFLISNDKKEFVKIEDLIATKPLSVIKKIKVIKYEGAECRPLPDISTPNNGIVGYGKELSVWKEYNDFYMVQAINKSIQWTYKSNCEDIV